MAAVVPPVSPSIDVTIVYTSDSSQKEGSDVSSSDDHKKVSDSSHAPLRQLGGAYMMVGGLLVGIGGGYLIDSYRDTSPFWTVLLAVLFMIAGFYHLIKDSKR